MAVVPSDINKYILLQNRQEGQDDETKESDTDGSDAVVAKVVAMCVLFTASMLLGCLPLQLNKWLNWGGGGNAKNNATVTVLLCIGGGILMATTFIHLLPEVSEQIEALEQFSDLPFPSAQLLMCIGFFTMYFVEETIHHYLEKRQNGILQRTYSIRRGEIAEENGKAPAKLEGVEGMLLVVQEDYLCSNIALKNSCFKCS